MHLQVISLEPGILSGEFKAVVIIDAQLRTFSVTVHDGEIRTVTFERELEQVLRGNPIGTKAFMRLIFDLHGGKSIELPMDLGDFGPPIKCAGEI